MILDYNTKHKRDLQREYAERVCGQHHGLLVYANQGGVDFYFQCKDTFTVTQTTRHD